MDRCAKHLMVANHASANQGSANKYSATPHGMVHAEFHQLKEKTMLRHYVQWCERPPTAFDTFSDGLHHLRHLQYLASVRGLRRPSTPSLMAFTISDTSSILQVHFSVTVINA
ncbi:hypothetical protein FB451DRAFT_1189834 [Mycena latifolia]|nr:hypothetical protein FB451DRAFT_1189834 [Mycena latifolia]